MMKKTRIFSFWVVMLFLAIGTHAVRANDDAIQSLINEYGKEPLIEIIIDKRFAQITVKRGDDYVDSFGKPNKDMITARTIKMDLEKIGISVQEFTAEVEEKLDRDREKSERLRSNPIANQPASSKSGKAKFEVKVRTGLADQACISRCKATFDKCMVKVNEDAKKCKTLPSGVDKCLSNNQNDFIRCSSKQSDCDDTCYK